MATSWIEDETSWKRCCAAAALASRGGEQSLLPATVQSELGCLTLLNSVELEQGRFDRLDARNEIKARLGKAFPQIHLDLKQQDPIKRFQIISSTLRIPTTGSPGCFDLNRELSDEFVCAFFRALKHRQVTESEFQGFRPEYFAYAQEKLSGELCVDAELKLQLLESLSPDPEPLRAKRLALHDLLAISPNLNLKQIGFGEQGADSKDRALVAIVEQLTYCPDPVKFAKLVSAVSDLKLSHSEILLGFLQHVLLLPGNEEQQGMLSWAHNAYERQCRGLIPELSARDALIFAQQVCFATLALSQETRGLILADLFSSTGEERIGKLAKLASLAIPKALESEFAQVGRANNLRAGFGLVHAFDLDVHVSQALAEACGYDWNDLLLEAIVERVVPHPPLLLFPLPVEVERKLEQRQTPELVKYMVLLGVASPLRLREAQIAHLAATHGLPLPPLENNNLAWSVHLAAPGVVETAEQAKGALAILHLLGEEANHEDLVVDLLMRLQEPDEWLAKFPSFPTRALDLVHGLAAKQREALAFEVALRPQHLDQCLEFLQTNVRATNEAVDFALLFQRLGLAKPVVRQVLARVERAMLALNSPDFSSSCCRLVVELVLVAKDIHRACELVWKLRKTVGGPSVALLALYLKQTQLGIQTNSSRLRFASDAKRKGAAEGIGRALQRCGESKPAVPQSVFPSSAGWEAELLPAAPKSSEHAKPLRRAKPKAVPTQTSGLEDLLTAAQPPPAKAKSVPVATWDEDELDFQEPSTKAKATAVNDDPLDLLLSSVPSAKKPAKTTLTKKKRPDFPAAEGVDSTLAFLLQPPPAAAFRKKT
ncbi:hypothetical protein BASA81_006902 [Batrachochytrium salamandrivorans]|nr:hypothetical protein BASA81_006902 [Batrachochytrium salamandrivorans]